MSSPPWFDDDIPRNLLISAAVFIIFRGKGSSGLIKTKISRNISVSADLLPISHGMLSRALFFRFHSADSRLPTGVEKTFPLVPAFLDAFLRISRGLFPFWGPFLKHPAVSRQNRWSDETIPLRARILPDLQRVSRSLPAKRLLF